jgi:hypothetical protein
MQQFIQMIEFRTSKLDEFEQLSKEWEAAATEKTVRRRVLVRDRDDAQHYFNIVFFDSFDEAMKNSDHPVTQEFAGRMMALADGEPRFHNLDVIDAVDY